MGRSGYFWILDDGHVMTTAESAASREIGRSRTGRSGLCRVTGKTMVIKTRPSTQCGRFSPLSPRVRLGARRRRPLTHAWPCADALPSGALPNSFAACQTAKTFHTWRGRE